MYLFFLMIKLKEKEEKEAIMNLMLKIKFITIVSFLSAR